MSRNDSAVIMSGGLDSTTLLYDMIDRGYQPHILSFDYGQRHSKELHYAAETAYRLKLEFDVIDLRSITPLISNSVLTDHAADVPEGHYAEDSMKATVVPNRNMIMLSIATGVCVSNQYRVLGVGVHAGDHFVYPDCRPGFIKNFEALTHEANDGFIHPDFSIYSPFLELSKTDIARRAGELDVPIELTWSCYKGLYIHCGKCGTCVERIEAIKDAGLTDPTEYMKYEVV